MDFASIWKKHDLLKVLVDGPVGSEKNVLLHLGLLPANLLAEAPLAILELQDFHMAGSKSHYTYIRLFDCQG